LTDFSPAFLGMFESLRMGPTFARGRRDERAGHVRSLTVSGSLAVALVRGPDDPTAFRARIAVRAFGASEWARVEKTLVAEARYVADLLDGRMPPGIEAVFDGTGLSLLPLSLDEVAMDCTCERWPMPCAHLAATCYALARAFESDPFEVFTWRGRSRDELLMRLRRLREAAAVDTSRGGPADFGASPDFGGPADSSSPAGDTGAGEARGGGDATAAGSAPSTVDPAAFWGAAVWSGGPGVGAPAVGDAPTGAPRRDDRAEEEWVTATGPGREGAADGRGRVLRPDALLDQLDPPGLTHATQPITEVLRVAYRALADDLGGD
jgi:uncharacterized Zn finger protein